MMGATCAEGEAMSVAPTDGLWYWVHLKDKDWFPAIADVASAGGWHNDDTWEDFHGEVDEWIGPISPERHASWGGHERELILCDGMGVPVLDPSRARDKQMEIVEMFGAPTRPFPVVNERSRLFTRLLAMMPWHSGR